MTNIPNRASENGWMADGRRHSDTPLSSGDGFRSLQNGKPVKTVIGVILLAVVALVLSLMHPVPHNIPDAPSWTTGQTTRPDAR